MLPCVKILHLKNVTLTVSYCPTSVQVQGILIGVVSAFVLIVTIIGPEYECSLLFLTALFFHQSILTGTMERDSKGTRQRSRKVVGTMTRSSTMTTTITRVLLLMMMRRLREHL